MKRAYLALVLVCFIVGLVAGVGAAQQRLKFAEPVLTDPGATDFALGSVTLDALHQRVEVVLREADAAGRMIGAADVWARRNANLGKVYRVTYEGEAAARFIAAMAIDAKVLAQLVADGKVPEATVVKETAKDVER